MPASEIPEYQRNKFSTTLSKARKGKGYSLRELSKLSGVADTAIGRMERGETNNPNVRTIEALSKALELRFTDLWPIEENGTTYSTAAPAGTSVAEPTANYASAQPFSVTVTENNTPATVLIPATAKGGYPQRMADEEYTAQLPTISLPSPGFQTFETRAFQVEGYSMEPKYPDGCTVIGTRVTDPYELINLDVYVVVLEDDIVVKHLKRQNGKLILISAHTAFPEVHVNPDEMREIWRVVAKVEIIDSRFRINLR